MEQRTIDEELERVAHIERLERSMGRWCAQGLDTLLPDEYARYCTILDHLRAGGAYVVRSYTSDTMVTMTHAELAADPVGRMFRDIAAGFAAVSRADIRGIRGMKK